MPKFSVDLDNVTKTISKKSFKLSEVKDKIEKIAFDVVRFKDGNPEELWQVHRADDGSEYIIALYNDEEKIAEASSKSSPWTVTAKNNDLHFFYKDTYLCKVASQQFGFTDSDMTLASRYLPKRLNTNKKLVNSLFKMVDRHTLNSVLTKYPELK